MYRLDQIEGALDALAQGKAMSAWQRPDRQVSKVLKTQIKRLLEIDRERARRQGCG